MPFPTFSAGQILTAADLTNMQWVEVSQGSNQTVNNSTTLVDSNIVVPVASGATYLFLVNLNFNSDPAADIKFDWTVPSGGSVTRFLHGPGMAATGGTDDYTTVNYRRISPGTNAVYAGSGVTLSASAFEQGELIGGNGGNITLQFAQQSADASNTVLNSLTSLYYLRLS
jgi:hypothetical protein